MRIAQTQVVTAVDGWTGRGIATMPSGAPHWLRRFDVFGVLPIVAKLFSGAFSHPAWVEIGAPSGNRPIDGRRVNN